jgi:cystathionine gamma-synthase
MRDLAALKAAIKPGKTKLIWVETPTNPMLGILDIAAISKVAKENGVLSVMDNTFATPYLQRPLELGADIVTHSTTKYIGGHSDLLGGAVIVNDEELYEKIRFWLFVWKSTAPTLRPLLNFLTDTKTLSRFTTQVFQLTLATI